MVSAIPIRCTARSELKKIYAELADRLADGSLYVDVEASFTIEDIKGVLGQAEREGRDGKILVTPNGPV